MNIAISSSVVAAMLDHSRLEHPREACGMLLGTVDRIVRSEPTANVATRPETSFEIEPAALLSIYRTTRGSGETVLGWYHSHPNGCNQPSIVDAARALEDGRLWLVVADGTVTGWRVMPQGDLYGTFSSVYLAVD